MRIPKYFKVTMFNEWGEPKEEAKFTLDDMASFHRQRRGFPTILTLGKYSGEGQSGGRFINELAKQLEYNIISIIGIDKYTQEMDRRLK